MYNKLYNMSINDGSAPVAFWRNDKRIDDLNTAVANSYVANADLDSKITALSKYALSVDIPDVSGKLDISALDTEIANLEKYCVVSDIPDVSGKLNISDLESSVDALSKYVVYSNIKNVDDDSAWNVFSTSKVNNLIANCAAHSDLVNTDNAVSALTTALNLKQDSSSLDADVASLGYQKLSAVQSAISTASYSKTQSDTKYEAKSDLESDVAALVSGSNSVNTALSSFVSGLSSDITTNTGAIALLKTNLKAFFDAFQAQSSMDFDFTNLNNCLNS